jgi:ATP-dependent helicase/nuclease subunit B
MSALLRTLILITPSRAAAVEIPRRMASTRRALAGVYSFELRDLARKLAEASLLTRGLKPWDLGHDALIATQLLDAPHGLRIPADMPRAPLGAALGRTLASLRRAGLVPETFRDLLPSVPVAEDAARLRALAEIYQRYCERVDGVFADPAALFRAAAEEAPRADWLRAAEVWIAAGLEPDVLERELLAALAQVLPLRFIEEETPPALSPSSFPSWALAHGLSAVPLAESPLAALARKELAPESLARLSARLFEPAHGPALEDEAVTLITAPGEAAEVRSVVRRLLMEARSGVRFEEMAVLLPRPDSYALLFADLFERLGIPYRLHPSLPLSQGRTARALLLLLRCRGLRRAAVMEFLTFAAIPFEEFLGADTDAHPDRWDALSREAGIVSGLERWIMGLRACAERERAAETRSGDPGRGEWHARRAQDAEQLLRIVELISATLDNLSGETSWPDWSARLGDAFEQWIAKGRNVADSIEREAVRTVIADLAGLGALSSRARWSAVEAVIETRLDWERTPLEPQPDGAIHVGALDALAGVSFRVVAIPGLVEGGFPPVLRPDPFLLDPERAALNRPLAAVEPRARGRRRAELDRRQLALFDLAAPALAPGPGDGRLPTTQDRLLESRRLFLRAIRQAQERLYLSYPRADQGSGRERLPSLFFVSAASTLAGKALAAAELARRVHEDDPDSQPLELAIDRGERDRIRMRRGGAEAEAAIAAGAPAFRQSRQASRARWGRRFSAFDGLAAPWPDAIARQVDPLQAATPISASRLATYAACGYRYLLQYVLRLEVAEEPTERERLDPLERGSLFHSVAERFLRGERDRGALPLQDTPALHARLRAVAEQELTSFVAANPPLYTELWAQAKERFHADLVTWLRREIESSRRASPAHFEVSFGLPFTSDTAEPHSREPLEIELGEGRTLRVAGKIDRIDRLPDGGLILRDYKTGKAPTKDDGQLLRGGKQLQVPFYILAAARLFPDHPVVEAFLDYIDGGRRITIDPAIVHQPRFRETLDAFVRAIADGLFVPDPAACDYCDFMSVCGPKPLIDRRLRHKQSDPSVKRYLRLRDL